MTAYLHTTRLGILNELVDQTLAVDEGGTIWMGLDYGKIAAVSVDGRYVHLKTDPVRAVSILPRGTQVTLTQE